MQRSVCVSTYIDINSPNHSNISSPHVQKSLPHALFAQVGETMGLERVTRPT
jgi:hypothetical protein